MKEIVEILKNILDELVKINKREDAKSAS